MQQQNLMLLFLAPQKPGSVSFETWDWFTTSYKLAIPLSPSSYTYVAVCFMLTMYYANHVERLKWALSKYRGVGTGTGIIELFEHSLLIPASAHY